MTDVGRVSSALKEMASLLANAGDLSWSQRLDQQAVNILQYGPEESRNILSLYGGMGSLSDVVLHKDGDWLVEENIRFDALRSELYEACNKLVHPELG